MTVAQLDHASRRDEQLFGVPYLGRATLLGAVVGMVLVVASAGLAVLLTDLPIVYLAAAVHAGLFGGIGFGAMLAAVLHITRHAPTSSEPHASATRRRLVRHTTTIQPTISSRETEPA